MADMLLMPRVKTNVRFTAQRAKRKKSLRNGVRRANGVVREAVIRVISLTLAVGEHLRLAVFPHGDARVRRPEVDADDVTVRGVHAHVLQVRRRAVRGELLALRLGGFHLGEAVVALNVVGVHGEAAGERLSWLSGGDWRRE